MFIEEGFLKNLGNYKDKMLLVDGALLVRCDVLFGNS